MCIVYGQKLPNEFSECPMLTGTFLTNAWIQESLSIKVSTLKFDNHDVAVVLKSLYCDAIGVFSTICG